MNKAERLRETLKRLRALERIGAENADQRDYIADMQFMEESLRELAKAAERAKKDYDEQGFVETDHMTAMGNLLAEYMDGGVL